MMDKAWKDSLSLSPNDNITQVVKNGSLDIGFIGLAEALVALTGSHHGELKEAQELGLNIISFMNETR
jgi:anaerobic ribonucleoside-triphosphate reductase